jgi:regulator of RNase E activity RraA
VVIESPPDATAASIGGIMSLRMAKNGVLGCVVSGRVRDVKEQKESGIEVWAGGRSSVATGAEAKVWGRECEVVVNGVTVRPGDVVFADGEEGCVVVVPRDLVGEVLTVVGGIVDDDDQVLAALREGMNVKEAFAKFRGKSTKWAS